MRQKMRTKEGKQIYARCGYTVEPVFGEIKWDGRKPSLLRGSVKVRGEFLLMCLVHNVKKMVKRVLNGTVGLPGMYNKAEGTVWAYREEREEQLTLVGAQV
jgi:transposase